MKKSTALITITIILLILVIISFKVKNTELNKQLKNANADVYRYSLKLENRERNIEEIVETLSKDEAKKILIDHLLSISGGLKPVKYYPAVFINEIINQHFENGYDIVRKPGSDPYNPIYELVEKNQ